VGNNPGSNIDPTGERVDSYNDVGNRFKYTCGCGWMDATHEGGLKMSRDMMGHFSNNRNAFRTPGYIFTVQNQGFGIVRWGVGPRWYSNITYRIKKSPPEFNSSSLVWRWMAAYIAYNSAWEAEVIQARLILVPGMEKTQWSYDDLTTDWLGVMQFLKYGGSKQKLLKDCGAVNNVKKERSLYNAMEHACYDKLVVTPTGGAISLPSDPAKCHRLMKLKIASPNNPLPYAKLFHKILKCDICKGISINWNNIRYPSSLYVEGRNAEYIEKISDHPSQSRQTYKIG
jgi:hypothetical protein